MRFFYTPRWLQALQPQYTWRVKNTSKKLFLTFDDGPIAEITPFVLDTLARFGAKATFFCVGDNIRKHPAIFQTILEQGHSVGNHTQHHLDGWRTENDLYIENIQACATYLPADCKLFRPPYGKIKSSQFKAMRQPYKIIMWDVLTYDFDAKLRPETCLQKTKKHTREGSIIVFHDSLKAAQNLQYVLPRYLEWAINAGFTFEAL